MLLLSLYNRPGKIMQPRPLRRAGHGRQGSNSGNRNLLKTGIGTMTATQTQDQPQHQQHRARLTVPQMPMVRNRDLRSTSRAGRLKAKDQTSKSHGTMLKSIVMLAVALLLLTSCDPKRVYEENVTIAEGNWTVDNAPVFAFEIQDTTQRYNIYFNVRYNLEYEFYNLYMRHQLTGPDGNVLSSQLHELMLMDAKTGKPLGKGSSDTFDLQALALKNVAFKRQGTYQLKLTQYMRRDPLANIQAIGVRVARQEQ